MNNKNILVGCDIGTSTIKIVVSQLENGNLNILCVATSPSEGIKKGQVVDIDRAVRSIKKAIAQAEEMVGMSIHSVHVGIGAFQTQIQRCEGVVAVSSPDRKITNEDKKKVREQSELVQIPQDREIIDVIPLRYKVDELEDIIDPRGMTGIRLEMSGIIITGLKTAIHNTISVVKSAGLKIAGVGYLPFTTGELALTPDEKEMGVVLIDIGGGTTSVSYYRDSEIIHAFSLPFGGENITKDLSQVLKTNTEDAEELKLKYGHAFYDFSAPEEPINLREVGTEKIKVVNVSMVAEIIEARLTEIFKMVQSEFERLGIESTITNVVLTGGALKMSGVPELAEHVFQKRVRIFVPNYISVREPQYTVNVSLLSSVFNRSKIEGRMVASGVGAERRNNSNNSKSQGIFSNMGKKDNDQDEVYSSEKKSGGMKNWLSSFFE